MRHTILFTGKAVNGRNTRILYMRLPVLTHPHIFCHMLHFNKYVTNALEAHTIIY